MQCHCDEADQQNIKQRKKLIQLTIFLQAISHLTLMAKKQVALRDIKLPNQQNDIHFVLQFFRHSKTLIN